MQNACSAPEREYVINFSDEKGGTPSTVFHSSAAISSLECKYRNSVWNRSDVPPGRTAIYAYGAVSAIHEPFLYF